MPRIPPAPPAQRADPLASETEDSDFDEQPQQLGSREDVDNDVHFSEDETQSTQQWSDASIGRHIMELFDRDIDEYMAEMSQEIRSEIEKEHLLKEQAEAKECNVECDVEMGRETFESGISQPAGGYTASQTQRRREWRYFEDDCAKARMVNSEQRRGDKLAHTRYLPTPADLPGMHDTICGSLISQFALNTDEPNPRNVPLGTTNHDRSKNCASCCTQSTPDCCRDCHFGGSSQTPPQATQTPSSVVTVMSGS